MLTNLLNDSAIFDAHSPAAVAQLRETLRMRPQFILKLADPSNGPLLCRRAKGNRQHVALFESQPALSKGLAHVM
ncbi:hypothetical protein BaRGS_00008192 [Batillaria attramentaria]|uniref:Uncharacterized protein n=1 Tax=Batillaria attramentaria TaxID=370345 RepID=A0ABD0LMN4_9CAEN